MTIQATGNVSLGGSRIGESVNLEIAQAATAMITMNDTNSRLLAGKPTTKSAISFSDFRGKTAGVSINPDSGFYSPAPIPVASDGYTLRQLGAAGSGSYVVANRWIQYTVNGAGEGALGNGSTGPGLKFAPLGNFAYGTDDYITPGNPWEGYAFEINGGAWYIGGANSGGGFGGTTNIWDVSATGNRHFIVKRGAAGTGFVVLEYLSYNDDPLIRIKMSYTNTTASSVTVRAMRGMDPDPDVFAFDEYDSNNTRGYTGIPATDLVTGLGVNSGKPVSLYCPGNGYTHNTAILSAWPTYNITSILSGQNDGYGDNAILCAWNIGTVAPGATVKVNCFWICGNDIGDVASLLLF
jgi:hypothetical protein